MLPEVLRRTRAVVGAWLRLQEARYNADLNAFELWQEGVLAHKNQLDELQAAIAEVRELQQKHFRLSRVHYDEISRLREKLKALRRTDAYAETFENHHPLISVPIATYNAAELLVDRAIASVREQTYDRWEIVVVGDGCTDDTEARLTELKDSRIRFVNLPFRTLNSDHPHERWWVSGAAPHNLAVELAQGEWIAPLDDDDEFLPRHMEALLDIALANRAEYVYGKSEHADGQQVYFSFPPELGQVQMQSVMYLRALGFFEWDTSSWVVEEPADWNLIRRMREAGVRMSATEEPVTRYYPSLGTRV